MTDDGVLNDEAMKEIAEQLKEKYDEIIEGNRKLLEKNMSLKKDLITLYSMFRILDYIVTEDPDIDPFVVQIIELGRGIASTMLDHQIFI